MLPNKYISIGAAIAVALVVFLSFQWGMMSERNKQSEAREQAAIEAINKLAKVTTQYDDMLQVIESTPPSDNVPALIRSTIISLPEPSK